MPTNDFAAALATVASDITRLLMDDPFPQAVQPAYLKEGVLAYPRRGGKLLRPALCLWSCGAVGGDPAIARHVAAAIEIFHTWTLVHDDIIDQDDRRRGEPAVHRLIADDATERFAGVGLAVAARFGENQAMLAGDIQQAWANSLVLKGVGDGVPPVVVLALLERLNRVVNPGLISGEAIDVEFELRPVSDVTTEEMEAMYRLKTGLLLRFAAEAGAMVGLGAADPDAGPVVSLGEFAAEAGLAFQLQDDLLGMFGDAASLGKPIGSDLRKGKRTLLFAAALERLDGVDRDFLTGALGNQRLSEADQRRATALIADCGARAWTEARAEVLIDSALHRLEQLEDTIYRELLREWAHFVTRRRT